MDQGWELDEALPARAPKTGVSFWMSTKPSVAWKALNARQSQDCQK